MRLSLPIDVVLGQVSTALAKHNTLIVRATPGSGKTTRIPIELLQTTDKKILVLEPRRLAAKIAATFVASQLNEPLGKTVGYQVRFDSAADQNTRILFITEGLLIRKFLSDPRLGDIGAIVLDEFHERHIHTDIALALADHLQQTTRTDLKLLVMSATLDLSDLQQYLNQPPIIDVEVPKHPVTIDYLPMPTTNTIDQATLSSAVERVLSNSQISGDILVFLPGARDIDMAKTDLMRRMSDDISILPLHASLPPEQQTLVFAKSSRRKIILATNVAESSLTIPGVRVVIDTGLAKIPSQAAWSGLPTLQLKPISQASCIQRTGRAAREGPGWCVRLYSEADFLRRRAFEIPEIQRLDLTQVLLELKAIPALAGDLDLRWLSAIDQESRKRSLIVLQLLGALDEREALTPLGQQMARLPLHPRLSRLCLAGRDPNPELLAPAIITAALLQEGVPKHFHDPSSTQDNDLGFAIHKILNLLTQKSPVNSQLPAALTRTIKQIADLLQTSPTKWHGRFSDEQLAPLLLTAFPDRVAKRRAANTARPEFNLCLGGGAILAEQCRVRHHDWLVVLDANESTNKAAAYATRIHSACAINAADILRAENSLLTATEETIWDEERQAAKTMLRRKYGQLVIEEKPLSSSSPVVLETLLAAKLKEFWPQPFPDAQALTIYQARCQIVGKVANQGDDQDDFLDLGGKDFELLIALICQGKKSFAEIIKQSLSEYINESLSYASQQQLDRYAPLKIKLSNGRLVDVNYELDKTPWIASRLQDFFGAKTSPTIGAGKIPLLIHLLAPNRRPVQVTQDLISFWQTSYPKLRNELSRNYPKHAWPEDPMDAEPPPLGRLR